MAFVCVNQSKICDGCCKCQELDPKAILTVCSYCGGPILKFEGRYEFPDGSIVHDDCVIEYIRQEYFKE